MADLKSKCVAYYTFDGISELTDSSAKGHLLTRSSSPTVTASGGKPNKFANTGSAGFYRISNSASDMSFSTGTTDKPFTFNFWINPTQHNSGAVQMLFTKRAITGGNVEYFISFNSNGDFRFITYSSGTTSITKTQTLTSANISDGVWQMFTCIYDGSNFSIYKNAVLQSTTRTNAGTYVCMNNTAEPISIGSWSTGSNNFSGSFDSIGIFNDILTQSEINTLYNNGNGLNLFDANNAVLLNGYGYGY